MRNKHILTMVAAGLVGFSGAAKALTIDNLADLIRTGGSLSIDDKVFSNFGYQSDLTTFDPSKILVSATQLGSTEYLTWTGNMSLAGQAGDTGDLLLQYTVTAINGHKIDMIDQFFVGNSVPSGTGHLSIDELVIDDSTGLPVANSHLEVGDIVDPPAEGGIHGDDLIIDPPSSRLDVIKDIGFGITAPNGLVTVSVVRQSFHQPSVIKGPDNGSTSILLGIAMSGLALLARKLKA